jgi:DNA polymerase
MRPEQVTNPSAEELTAQLANWLELVHLSGTREIVVGKVKAEASSRRDGAALLSLRETVSRCKGCGLHTGRTNVVFGEGSPSAELMFIGEGPGRDEDVSGRPFVGRAGELLTKIIRAMGLARADVYIANIVKCRPPGNRNPEPDEILACLPFLEEQIDLIRPRVICTLGNTATQTISGERRGISSLRGTFCTYKGITVMPTFHPAACLRNPSNKRLVWDDMKKVMKELNLPIRGVGKDGASKNRN